MSTTEKIISFAKEISRSGGCPTHLFLPLRNCFELGFTKERLIEMGMEWDEDDERVWLEFQTCNKV